MRITGYETTAWKPIPGFSRYDVSDTGHVRNTRTGRFLKTSLATGNYPKLNLRSDDGKSQTVFVNVAVLSAFIGAIPEHATILYRDESRRNCTLYNLGWETPDERTLIVPSADGYRLVTLPLVLSGRYKPSTVCRGPEVKVGPRKGHPLSLDGNQDDNTLIWGFGNRVCRTCDAPHGLPALGPLYSLEYGTAHSPEVCSTTAWDARMPLAGLPLVNDQPMRDVA